MRRKFAAIFFLLLLGVVVTLEYVRILPLQVDLVINLEEFSLETARGSTASEQPRSNASLEKTSAVLAAADSSSTDLGIKLSPGVAIDIARVSQSGPSVFAGRAPPFARVTLFENAAAIATATANANGDWSIVTEYKFADGNPEINLRIGDRSEKGISEQAAELDSVSPTSMAGTRPPAARLLKEFKDVVATAREEAKLQGRAKSSVNDGKANGLVTVASTEQSAQIQGQVQRQDVNLSLSKSESQPEPSSSTMPIPMTFVYNEATLTTEGQQSARLLLEYLNLKKFVAVTLSGHADERGLPNYNMELSRQRLLVIMQLLRDGGYQGKLDLVPKGSTEPYMGVDRSRYPREELMQLDRRVELRVAK